MNHGLNSWMPPDSEPFMGIDRTLTPARLSGGREPWSWWQNLRWRFGTWLESLGRKIQP